MACIRNKSVVILIHRPIRNYQNIDSSFSPIIGYVNQIIDNN